MVERQADVLSPVFRALSDPTRREMLRSLAEHEELTVGELAEPFSMSLAGASKHVRVLERAGLVHRTVSGRTHRCRLDPRGLVEARGWLGFYERFWTERLDALDDMLGSQDPARDPDREERSV